MKYAIVIEKTPNNYAAYAPDLPGCVATADTRKEVIRLMREGIPFHIEGLREGGGASARSASYCCRSGSPSSSDSVSTVSATGGFLSSHNCGRWQANKSWQ